MYRPIVRASQVLGLNCLFSDFLQWAPQIHGLSTFAGVPKTAKAKRWVNALSPFPQFSLIYIIVVQ